MTVYVALHGGQTSVLDTWEAAAQQLAHGGTTVCAFESRAAAAAWRPAHDEEEAETAGEAPADCTVALAFEIDEDGTAAVGAAIAQPDGGAGWRGGRLLHGAAAHHEVIEVEALVHALEAARTLAGWADRVCVHGCSAALLCQLGPSASAEAAPCDAAALPALESLLGRARLLLTELGEPALRPPPEVADWGALPLEQPQQLWREARALAAKALATRRSGSELLLAPELHPLPLLPAATAPLSPPRAPAATRCASLPGGPLASFLQPAAAATAATAAAGTAAAKGAAEPDAPPDRAPGAGGATEAVGSVAGSVAGVRLREASGWECTACTYLHEGAEAGYLACSLCGAERPKGRGARPAKRPATGAHPAGRHGGEAAAAAATAARPAAAASGTAQGTGALARRGAAAEGGEAARSKGVVGSSRPLLPFEEREILSQIGYEQRRKAEEEAQPPPQPPQQPQLQQPEVGAALPGVELWLAPAPQLDRAAAAAASEGGAAAAAEEVAAAAPGEPEPPPRVWRREQLCEWLAEPAQAGVTLDPQQLHVVRQVCEEKRSVFLTGPGGVGKSFVTKVMISFLREVFAQHWSRAVAITAPTGIAATHIGGTTIHAAFGVGVPSHVSDFERRMRGNPTRAKAVAQHLEVLLVDEVSMLAAEFLDLLDEQLRALVSLFGRGVAAAGKGEKPAKLPAFGGVQLVACGDFFQLPPIPSRVPQQTWPRLRPEDIKQGRAVLYSGLDRSKREELFLNRGFAFQAESWWRADLLFVELTRVWRQRDEAMVAVLNRIRRGTATPADLNWLNSHCAADSPPPPRPPSGSSDVAAAASGGDSAAGAAAAAPPPAAPPPAAPPPRPMLLAPTNDVVNERNAREMALIKARGAAAQWLAADWVEADEGAGPRLEAERSLQRCDDIYIYTSSQSYTTLGQPSRPCTPFGAASFTQRPTSHLHYTPW